ncbi:MAG: PstS family phosphate ABC transporter substrate-binding protein [Spirochaetaceae bacterium]
MKQTVLAIGLVLVVVSLGFAGGDQEQAADTGDDLPWLIETGGFPDVNPLEVEGDIIIAGSSTVFPLAEAIAERFQDEGYGGNITIDSIGSGGGFERFCTAAESDISNASSPIRNYPEEIEACRENGREHIEIRIGTDALAVVVNPENDWISEASIEELAEIFTAENWSDVNPSWPDEPILRFIPGTDSGTFVFFVEEVFDENEEPILAAPNTQLSEDDNILVQGIEGSPNAIGFFGYAYYANEGDALKILDIEGITPSAASVDAGEYPLARPLFMYTAASVIAAKPQAAAFLAYVLNYVNDVIGDVGYFPANEEALNGAKDAWMDAMADQM